MKVAIVRGNCLNKWDMQYFPNLIRFGINPVGLCSEDNRFDVSDLGFPVIKLKRFGQYNKVPLISRMNNYFLCYNHYFFGFDNAIKDFDLIHSTEINNVFTYQAVKTGKPVIVSCWENIPFNGERWNYKRFKKVVKKNARHFIAVTEKAKEVLKLEGVNEDRISVIPPGLDTSEFKPNKKVENDKVVILFVGRLVKGKGILVLIEALKNIKEVK